MPFLKKNKPVIAISEFLLLVAVFIMLLIYSRLNWSPSFEFVLSLWR